MSALFTALQKNPNSMALLTLYYLPMPGRAEAARLMLTIGKIGFVVRVSVQQRFNGVL